MNVTLEVGKDLPAARVPQAPGSSAALAAALVELERLIEAQQPEQVLLTDDSDAALAAALVATKLLVPVAATNEATGSGSVNARLISQLAAAYTESR
jgi:UDP-N-acetylglucosamine 2-epimerase